jgi:dCMP deaminase
MDDTLISELMGLAYRHAYILSDDPSTKNGAIIYRDNKVVGYGVNRFTRGVDVTPERLQRPAKYAFMEHAERNAIYSTWENGYSPVGAIMVCPWFSCADCARAIVAAGIVKIIGHSCRFTEASPTWAESINYGNQILDEGWVERVYWSGPISNCVGFWDGIEHKFDAESNNREVM